MWTLFTTLFRSLWSKAGLWLVTGMAVITALAGVLLKTYSAGKAAERLRQVDNTLKEVKDNARIQAEHDSLSAADARKRLLDKWGQR